MGKMLVNVFSSPEIVGLSLRKRVSGDADPDAEGVARTCCTFLAPASWVRMEGHLMA